MRIRALSFRVLAHAEIETYFEDRVVEIAQAAWRQWKARRHVSYVSLHLLAFSGRSMDLPPDTLEAPDPTKRKSWPDLVAIHERLEKATANFIYRVRKENHGVKEKNLLAMLLPVGFDATTCDRLFVARLDQFGEDRGKVAHSSASAHLGSAIDPSEEYQRVRSIIDDIKPIDGELDRLLKLAGGSGFERGQV